MKAIIITPSNSAVNVRVEPNPEAESIGIVESGDIVEALATQGDWTNVLYNGTNGWIYSKYVVLESEAQGEVNGRKRNKLREAVRKQKNLPKVQSMVKTAGSVKSGRNGSIFNRLRSRIKKASSTVKAAADKASKVTSVSASATNGIDEYNADEIEALDGLFDKIKEAFRKVKRAFGFSGLAGFSIGQTLYVATQKDPLVLRKTASTSGTKITSIPKGSAVTVADTATISQGGHTWLKINYSDKTGYAATTYLSTTKPSTNTNNTPKKSTVTDSDSSSTDNNSFNNQNDEQMAVTENVKKYIKIGVGVVGAAAVAYLGYKLCKGNKGKGLSGVSKRKRKSTKESSGSHKRLPMK